ncbi:hypothetical protein SODALDRAFT_374833, partial [Sodiomyces alkalinus F11]
MSASFHSLWTRIHGSFRSSHKWARRAGLGTLKTHEHVLHEGQRLGVASCHFPTPNPTRSSETIPGTTTTQTSRGPGRSRLSLYSPTFSHLSTAERLLSLSLRPPSSL